MCVSVWMCLSVCNLNKWRNSNNNTIDIDQKREHFANQIQIEAANAEEEEEAAAAYRKHREYTEYKYLYKQ